MKRISYVFIIIVPLCLLFGFTVYEQNKISHRESFHSKPSPQLLPEHDNAIAHNHKAHLYLKKKLYDRAEAELHKALELQPGYGRAHYNLGRLYYETNKLDSAWQSFKNATMTNLNTIEGFNALGHISLQVKKYDEAVNAFENVLFLTQKSQSLLLPHKEEECLFNLANAYVMNKDHDKAYELYSKLTQKNPADHRYSYNLGETLYAQGKYEQALTAFHHVTTTTNTMPQTHLRIAHCLEKMEQSEQARNHLSLLLEKNELPHNVKKEILAEFTRLELQEKVDAGKGSIRMDEILKAMQKLDAQG